MLQLLLIALAGAAGAVVRYLVGLGCARGIGSGFPYGTLLVNVVGCFLLGLIMHLGPVAKLVPRAAFTALTVGFLGGLTTFSAFGYQTADFIENCAYFAALGNVVANLVLGLGAVFAGLALGRALAGVG